MPPTEFELAFPSSERPQTYALDGPATGIGIKEMYTFWISRSVVGIYDTTKDIDHTVHVRNVKYAVEGTSSSSSSSSSSFPVIPFRDIGRQQNVANWSYF